MFTSLYLTNVLPASMPSAALKTMVMVGPSLRTRWTAIPMATTAARIGMTQTTEMRTRRRGTTVACGRSSRSMLSGMTVPPGHGRVPDQAGIEGLRRYHRQHDDRREEEHPQAGLHRHQGLELYEGDGERVDEHVQHRPAADELDHAIQPGAVAGSAERAALHRDQQVDERNQLAERHHHARHQHDEGEGPRSRGVEEHHSTHDGVGVGGPERVRGEDGQGVRGDVADRRGHHERPRVLDRVVAAPCELCAAAGAVPRLGQASGSREQAARLAGNEARPRAGEDSGRHRSAHSTRFQISSGSKVIMIAVRSGTSPPTAYIPMPGSTVASSAILISATRMPRIITSFIDQGCMAAAQRSISPTHWGGVGRLAASKTVSMNMR